MVGSNLKPIRSGTYSFSLSFNYSMGAFSIIGVTVLVVLAVAAGANIAKTSGDTQAQNSAPGVPSGFPGGAQIASIGTSLVPMIENTPQFQSLANGTQYHIEPYSSFGYSWGPTIPSVETIIFFSPNLSGEIEVSVYLNNNTIQHMYFDNETLLGYTVGPTPAS